MKISRILVFSGLGILVLIILIAGYFKFFSGLKPALGPVKGDIATIIDAHEKQDNNSDSDKPINETKFPLKLSVGTKISIFANNVANARLMAIDSEGILYLSQTKSGRVVALPDRDNDGQVDEIIEIISGLNQPHGLAFSFVKFSPLTEASDYKIALLPAPDKLPDPEAFKNTEPITLKEYLYIAETDRIIRLEKIGSTSFGQPEVIVNNLPIGGRHSTRSLAIAGDKLYVSIGSSCNVCNESNKFRAAIWQYDLDGKNGKLYASGLRNSVGLKFNPNSGKLWATENGRDLLGDDTPPDEINIIEEGGNYGWPTCYGHNAHDTDFDKNTYIRQPCLEPFEKPSHINLPAHVAPLGLEFYQGSMFPELADSLLVALHGSWNRSIPVGYKVLNIKLKGESVIGIEDFISGWLVEEKTAGITNYSSLGRPVDVISGSQGEIYISDDKAGVVYLVTKTQKSQKAQKPQ